MNDDLGLEPSLLTLAPGGQNALVVDVGNPAAAPLAVNLVSSDPSVAAVPATTIVPPGSHIARFSVKAGKAGTATIHATVGGLTAWSRVMVETPRTQPPPPPPAQPRRRPSH